MKIGVSRKPFSNMFKKATKKPKIITTHNCTAQHQKWSFEATYCINFGVFEAFLDILGKGRLETPTSFYLPTN